jgi:hypothetical protein
MLAISQPPFPAPIGVRPTESLAIGLPVLAAKAVDAALSVDQTLLARIERVTGAADVHRELRARGARLEAASARTGDFDDLILRVNPVFHFRPALGLG